MYIYIFENEVKRFFSLYLKISEDKQKLLSFKSKRFSLIHNFVLAIGSYRPFRDKTNNMNNMERKKEQ